MYAPCAVAGRSTGAFCRSSSMKARIQAGWSGHARAETIIPSTTASASTNSAPAAVTSGATNVDILENRVVHAERHGIDVTTVESGAVQVRGNDALGNDVDGISFGPDTVNNLVRRNVALDNGDLDCHDESTGTNSAGTANFWRNNTGVTDDPSGLCRPPEA